MPLLQAPAALPSWQSMEGMASETTPSCAIAGIMEREATAQLLIPKATSAPRSRVESHRVIQFGMAAILAVAPAPIKAAFDFVMRQLEAKGDQPPAVLPTRPS